MNGAHSQHHPKAGKGNRSKKNDKKLLKALLSILGPAIVFATFIYKDVLKEQQKDLSDSLQAAQTAFLTAESVRKVSQQIWQMNSDLHEMMGHEMGTNFERANSIPTEERADLAEIDRDELDTVERLANAVPKSSSPIGVGWLHRQKRLFDNYISNLKGGLKEGPEADHEYKESVVRRDTNSARQLDALRQNGSNYYGAIETDFLEIIKTNAAIRDEYLVRPGITHDTTLLLFEPAVVASSRNDLFRVAMEEGEKAESRYKRFTTYSYYLYALGFVVGLVGKVVGAEGVSEEAE